MPPWEHPLSDCSPQGRAGLPWLGGPWGGLDLACSHQSDLRGALAWPSLHQSLWVHGAHLQTVWMWLLPCGPRTSRSRQPQHGQGLPPAREEPGPGRGVGCQQQDLLRAHPPCPILWAEGSASSSRGHTAWPFSALLSLPGREQSQTCSRGQSRWLESWVQLPSAQLMSGWRWFGAPGKSVAWPPLGSARLLG